MHALEMRAREIRLLILWGCNEWRSFKIKEYKSNSE